MAKGKGKGKPAAPVALAVGDNVKVQSGDFGNSRGTVEKIAGGKASVRVHGRLTVLEPVGNLSKL